MIDEKTREWFRKKGAKGGRSTMKKYGTEHFRKISIKGKVIHSKGVVKKEE